MNPAGDRLLRAAVVAVLLGASTGSAASPVAAAEPVLPRPGASVRFLSGITFTGTAQLSEPVRRLEIVIDFEGSDASLVADVAGPGASGTVDLRYVLETPGGGLYPNTRIDARFRATLDDGTFVSGPDRSIRYEDTRYDWQSLTGDLVTVHWIEGDAAFGRRALRIGEDAVRSAGELFGVTESEPIDFFVYPDEASFYDVIGAGARENVGGTALPEIRTLFAKIEPDRIDDPWVGVVVPHELTHLVFSSAIANPYHDPPHWLDEGIASYLSEGYGPADRSAVEGAIRSGTFMPLRALTGQFPTTADQWYLAYAEANSAIDFLVRQYGRTAMVQLVRSYADGVTDDEAFLAALGTDAAGFEAAWLAELGVPAPVPHGPREAPPGPLPSDWLGDAPVPGDIDSGSAPPAPLPTVEPGSPDKPGGAAPGDVTGLLVVLLVAGLAVAGLGAWLARRNRPIRLPEEPLDVDPFETPPDRAPDAPPDADPPPDERAP